MSDKKPDLSDAYALQSPEDAQRLYREWSATYDVDFVEAEDYRLPEVVALAFAGRGGQGPVLDVGAGTGAVGEHLARLGVGPVEALDLSPEMLKVAEAKGHYAALIEADLTRPLDLETAYYNGVVSAGTFTQGHVGPEALDELLRVTAHGGLVCLSVYRPHFVSRGFGAKLEALAPMIRDLRIDEGHIYGERAAEDHRAHIACIVSFHRA